MYARQDDSGTMNLGGLANAQVATGGTFARHNRTIEIAMKWADIAASVESRPTTRRRHRHHDCPRIHLRLRTLAHLRGLQRASVYRHQPMVARERD